MNSRNLEYIKKFNPKKGIRLADNKLKTRRFMEARGIPVPTTYDVIRNRRQLYTYNFRNLPADEFIVKPNKGSRGRGIYRVKVTDEKVEHTSPLNRMDRLFTARSPYWYEQYKISGKLVEDTDFRRYLVDILDGKSSIGSRHDTIILEELLLPGSGFEAYCDHGLADIRIIVFNLVPVAAMLRIPTEESDGKANLDRGAVGCGVEIGSGKITSMYHHGEISYKKFSGEYKRFGGRTLPYWEDILMYSSKIQYFVNMGFLALDRVITEDGPKLLEINARAGLKFQLASLLPLKKRLQKIGDLKITSPEKGVQIAQSLFTEQKSHIVTPSKIVYLSQHATCRIQAEKKLRFDTIVEVDVTQRKNYLSKNLFKHIENNSEAKVDVYLSHHSIVFSGLTWYPLKGTQRNKIILGKDAVEGYYIKPIHKIHSAHDFISPSNLIDSELDQIQILDRKLALFTKRLNVSRIFKPINFLDEMDNFITWNGKYNPRFEYRRPSRKILDATYDELHALRDKYFGSTGLQSKFSILFRQKIDHFLDKVEFISAYKAQDQERILHANEKLYGSLDIERIALAKEELFSPSAVKRKELGPILPIWKVKEIIETYLKEKKFSNVKVVFDSNSISRMSVSRGKNIVFRVNHEQQYREKMLLAILAHEVDVHVRRHQAGLKTGWNLLKSGTANYIIDEEGLAIYHSNQVLPDGFEKLGMYEKYYLLHEASNKDFSATVDLVRSIRQKNMSSSFKTVFRIKKGIEQTFRVGGGTIFYKNKIYLDGYIKVNEWIENGGNPEQLMLGKIKIDDLKYII